MITYSKLTAVFNYLYLLSVLFIYILAVLSRSGSGAELLVIPFFVSAPLVGLYNLIYLTILILHRKQFSFAKHRKLFIASILGASLVLVIQVSLLVLFISSYADSKASISKDKKIMQQFDKCVAENNIEYCQKVFN